MVWQVLILAEAQDEIRAIALASGIDYPRFEDAVLAHFEDAFKAERLEKFLHAGVSSSAIDRLAGSVYQPSIRLQVHHDFRVTAWCFPPEKEAIITHAFQKSRDPNYKRAVPVHDARLSSYVRGLADFLARKSRK